MTTCHGPSPPEEGGGAVQRQPLPPDDHDDRIWALLQSLPTVAMRGFRADIERAFAKLFGIPHLAQVGREGHYTESLVGLQPVYGHRRV